MSDLTWLKDSAASLIDELTSSAISVSTTYSTFTGTTYDTNTGQDLATYTTATLQAYYFAYKPEEIMQSNGQILEDDVVFMYTVNDLTEPAIFDKITYNSIDYNVIKFTQQLPHVRWKIHARRYK